jgi:hypothetical protein
VHGKDEERGCRRPDNKNNPGIGLGNLKNKKIKKDTTDNRCPPLENDEKFAVKFPSPPGTVKLKVLKAYEGNDKNNPFQPIVVKIPGNAVTVDKQPEKAADEGAVDEVENSVNNGTTFTQIPGEKRRHGS